MSKKKVLAKTESKRDENLFQRRLKMMYWLSEVRQTTYEEIGEMFHLNPGSIKIDLDYLENDCDVPLIRIRGKGTRVADNWYASKPHLLPEDERFLLLIRSYLPEEKKKKLDEIIRKYGNPKSVETLPD